MKVGIELAMVSGKHRVRVGTIELDVTLSGAIAQIQEPKDHLTPREVEVRDSILLGLCHKEIADKLHLAVRTVKFHAGSLYQKYGVGDRGSLVYLLTHLKKALEGQ